MCIEHPALRKLKFDPILETGKADPNVAILEERAGITALKTLLKQKHLGWLGSSSRMRDEHIPKDILHSELAAGISCASHHRPTDPTQAEAPGMAWSFLPHEGRAHPEGYSP